MIGRDALKKGMLKQITTKLNWKWNINKRRETHIHTHDNNNTENVGCFLSFFCYFFLFLSLNFSHSIPWIKNEKMKRSIKKNRFLFFFSSEKNEKHTIAEEKEEIKRKRKVITHLKLSKFIYLSILFSFLFIYSVWVVWHNIRQMV